MKIPASVLKPRPYAQRLRAERVRLGLTQTELATRGGVSKTSQVNYELDVYLPDVEYLAAIAAAGVDALYVLTGQTERGRAAKHFNWSLVEQLLTFIDEWADGLKVAKATPATKVELLRLFYPQFDRDGTSDIDLEVVARTLKLVHSGPSE